MRPIFNLAPPIVLFAAYGVMLWDFFMVEHGDRAPDLMTVLLIPLAITFAFLMMIHTARTLAKIWSRHQSN